MNDVVNPAAYDTLAITAHDNGLYGVTLNRPDKRNALDVATIEELIRFFSGARMAGVKAREVVLHGFFRRAAHQPMLWGEYRQVRDQNRRSSRFPDRAKERCG